MSGPAEDSALQAVIRACYSAGQDLSTLHRRLLHSLDRVVSFDAAFMAGADPDTLLFTSAFGDDALMASSGQFLDNEFGADHDVNRFADLARATDPVASLDGLTAAQGRVANLVLQGRTTGQIVVDLSISAHTVQDHLKAVFDKVGVRSRRDLASALMRPSRG